MRLRRDEADERRFWGKVNKTATCWIYTGNLQRGYGQFKVARKSVRAHRYSYELAKGKIPKGLVIDHLCRIPACVNPDHLEAVTDWVNVVARGTGITAINARKTHCRRGHEYNADNTYVDQKGSRLCHICIVQWKRDKVAREREQTATYKN